MPRLALIAFLLLTSCQAVPEPTDAGPHPVGHVTITIEDAGRSRQVPVHVWYPAAASAKARADAGVPIALLIADDEKRAKYESLLEKAPADCPTRTVHSAPDAPPADGPWPLVVYSHCHGCTGLSIASVAERLASHGIALAAPDHEGNTLFDRIDGELMGLTEETLRMRVSDVRLVLDRLVGGQGVPDSLRGRFDETRLAAMGHSFGSVTTGTFAEEEPRLKAIVALAAPIQNPLLPFAKMANIAKPVLFVVAREDNSITEFGNDFIRDNFEDAPSAAWKVEVDDAGHFSFSDLAGLDAPLVQGCGEAQRQTLPDETFRYLPVTDAIGIARDWATAFFASHLQGSETARAFLANPPRQPGVDVESHR